MRGHHARKRFGQNFLADPHYVARIVEAIAPQPGDNLVEVGPGLGALTRPLIERAGRLAAIEIDRDLAARLATEFPPERLVLHLADALAFDFTMLGEHLRIVGNLPYNISSPLLFHLAQYDERLVDLHVMLQRSRCRMIASPSRPTTGDFPSCCSRGSGSRGCLPCRPARSGRPNGRLAVARLVPLSRARPRSATAIVRAHRCRGSVNGARR
jgi:16S rRNA (adenine1518-N6/adenine1519-N6)-dimethyltransferase